MIPVDLIVRRAHDTAGFEVKIGYCLAYGKAAYAPAARASSMQP